MTTVLAVPDNGGLPVGARQLGIRVKPIIRLGMGVRDQQRGFPRKTDYFTVRGDDRAVAKFLAEYGDKPKAVEILLPSDIDVALTIQYRAFKGAAGGEGGTLVAIGHTNFAMRDYCGGADVLTVWDQDGTVRTVETLGLDGNTRQPLDQVAKDLGLELYTTFRAGLPRVLGFGSYFDVSTKGKQSTDNLWAKLRELYGLFGSRVSFAMKPQLVMRESTARPVVTKDGVSKRTTTSIYVLDIVVPETIDEMIDRLQERQALLPGGSAVAALYGSQAAIEAAPAPHPPSVVVDGGALPDFEEVVEEGEYDEPDAPVDEPAAAAEPSTLDDQLVAAELALDAVIPASAMKGQSLRRLLEARPKSDSWWRNALSHDWRDAEFEAAVAAVAAVYLTDLDGGKAA